MAPLSQMDCTAQVPEVVVKNTFLDFDVAESSSSLGNQSLSCPAEVLSPSQARGSDDDNALADCIAGISEMRMCDLAAAAQMFSNLKISRTEMESSGHVASRSSESDHVDVVAERTWGFDSFSSMDFQGSSGIGGPAPQFKPPPPPLSAACFSEDITPEAPNWTPKVDKLRNRPVPPPLSEVEQEASINFQAAPKVGTDALPSYTPKVETGDATPEAPAWTPKVGSIGTAILQGPAPPPAPAPVILQLREPVPAPSLVPLSMPASAPTPAPPPAPAPALAPPMLAPALAPVVPYVQDFSVCPPIQNAPEAPQVWWYRVSFLGGIALRNAPSIDAPRTGHMLYQNETFAVRERIQGSDGRVYLLLADYRGWAFDDSALMPHDPSVVRGRWSAMDTCASYASGMPLMGFDQSLVMNGQEQTKRRRRRKRGGVKRNKNKRARAQAEAEALLAKDNESEEEAEEDADTEAPSEEEDAPLEADSISCDSA